MFDGKTNVFLGHVHRRPPQHDLTPTAATLGDGGALNRGTVPYKTIIDYRGPLANHQHLPSKRNRNWSPQGIT